MKNDVPITDASVLAQLRKLSDTRTVSAVRRFGVTGKNILGIPIPTLRALARRTGKNHRLAAALWRSRIHEARILAAYVEEVDRVTPAQMEKWAENFDSWDVCDQVCGNLFVRTSWAGEKAAEWSGREKEFVKRAGFVLMANLAVHDKKAPDAMFLRFLPMIEREAGDERNFVRKAVNWALRQIGKRNPTLRRKAIKSAERVLKQESASAKWVARDALRELRK